MQAQGGIYLIPIYICVDATVSKQGDSLGYYAKLLTNIASKYEFLEAGYAQTSFGAHFSEDLRGDASSR